MQSCWKKNATEVTLKLSSNIVDDFNDENNFTCKLLLTNTQVLRLCQAFANNSLTNMKLSKTQLHKIGQSGRFLGRFFSIITKNFIAFNRKCT